jgi:hypothetical protein
MYLIRRWIIYITTAIIVLCMPLLESCTVHVKPVYIEDEKLSAEQEIEKFHLRFSSGDYEAIYDSSALDFKKSIPKNELLTYMKNAHEEFGDFRRIIGKRVNVIIGPPIQIRVVYISQYTKTDLTELFNFIKNGEETQLAQYRPFKGRSKLPTLEGN